MMDARWGWVSGQKIRETDLGTRLLQKRELILIEEHFAQAISNANHPCLKRPFSSSLQVFEKLPRVWALKVSQALDQERSWQCLLRRDVLQLNKPGAQIPDH
jgi:hypothetical protein